MSWLLAFLGFAALIILHELGHFTAAKAVGMRVERFSLFFPPLLARVRRGETEYAVGAIPLGGYVKITGMNPAEEIPPEVAHRAYYRQPVWKRIVVDRRRAGGQHRARICPAGRDLPLAGRLRRLDRTGRDASTRAKAAAQVLQPGDRVVAVDGKRGDIEALRRQITTHRCAGEQVDGCKAATPARVTRGPRRQRADVLDHARLRGGRQAPAARLQLGRVRRATSGSSRHRS